MIQRYQENVALQRALWGEGESGRRGDFSLRSQRITSANSAVKMFLAKLSIKKVPLCDPLD